MSIVDIAPHLGDPYDIRLAMAEMEFRSVEHAITSAGRIEVTDTLAREWGVSREDLLARVKA